MTGTSLRIPGGAGTMRIEEVEIDSVRNDRPVRLEVAIEGDRRRMRHGDRGCHSIELALEPLRVKPVEIRSVEVRVERADDRAVGFIDRDQRKRRAERRMDMHDVVLSAPQHVSQLLAEVEPDGHPRLRAVEVDRLARADADDVRLGVGAFEVRRDDVDVMTEPARFAREEMDVLADAAEVRIVVLGDERDTEWTRETAAPRGSAGGRRQIQIARARLLRTR